MGSRAHRGFTLTEMLAATLVVVMLSAMVAAGVRTSMRQWEEQRFWSQAEVLNGTIQSAIASPIRYMTYYRNPSGSYSLKLDTTKGTAGELEADDLIYNDIVKETDASYGDRAMLYFKNDDDATVQDAPLFNPGVYGTLGVQSITYDEGASFQDLQAAWAGFDPKTSRDMPCTISGKLTITNNAGTMMRDFRFSYTSVYLQSLIRDDSVARLPEEDDPTPQVKTVFYTVQYYKDGVPEPAITYQRDVLSTDPDTIAIDSPIDVSGGRYAGFELDRADAIPAVGTEVPSGTVIGVWYRSLKVTNSYTVQYWRGSTLDEDATYTVSEEVRQIDSDGTIAIDRTIDADPNRYEGYELSHTLPTTLPAVGTRVSSGTTIQLHYVATQNTIGYAAMTIGGDGSFVGGTVSRASETVTAEGPAPLGSTARPNPGFDFLGWQDADGRTVSTALAFVPASRETATYVAAFQEKDPVTITYRAGTGGSVSTSSESVAPVTGAPAGSVATPAANYHFVNWTYVDSQGLTHRVDGEALAPVREGGILMPYTYTANFSRKPKKTISITIAYVVDGTTVETQTKSQSVEQTENSFTVGDIEVKEFEGYKFHGFLVGEDASYGKDELPEKVPAGSTISLIYEPFYIPNPSGKPVTSSQTIYTNQLTFADYLWALLRGESWRWTSAADPGPSFAKIKKGGLFSRRDAYILAWYDGDYYKPVNAGGSTTYLSSVAGITGSQIADGQLHNNIRWVKVT